MKSREAKSGGQLRKEGGKEIEENGVGQSCHRAITSEGLVTTCKAGVQIVRKKREGEPKE